MKYFKIKKVLVILLVIFCLVVSFQAVLAQDYGLNETADVGGLYDKENPIETDLSGSIGNIIGAALSFIGIIFFILMVYAGFLWMTARGNDEKVGQAISILMQATIGLIIVAGAYLITKFAGETIIDAFL